MALSGFQQRSCARKIPFTEEEARSAVKAIRKRGQMKNFTRIQPYKYSFCPWWHLGHTYFKQKSSPKGESNGSISGS